MSFTKATRKKSKLRLAITGPSGSGKSYSALLLSKGLGGKIAAIDTEKGSLSLYENIVPFDVMELKPPYTPEAFINAIHEAERSGYEILIIDSLSHEWSGSGGCLELVDELAHAKYRGNSWSAWNEVTPRHRALLDAIMSSPCHIIATMRSKTETAQVEENGKKKVAKLGMKSEQRDGTEYEFTTVLDLSHDGHYAMASKDRTELFMGKDPKPITVETGKMLMKWLDSGVDAPIPQNKVPAVSREKLILLCEPIAQVDPIAYSEVLSLAKTSHDLAVVEIEVNTARRDAREKLNSMVKGTMKEKNLDKAGLDQLSKSSYPTVSRWEELTLEQAFHVYGEIK